MRTVKGYINRHAGSQGERIFLIDPDTNSEITYSSLQQRVGEMDRYLNAMGVATGAKVAFLLDNGACTASIFLGVMASNRVIVPLNAVAGTVQLQYVLDHSDAEMVFVSDVYRECLDELLTAVDREVRVVGVDAESGPRWPVAAAAPGDADDSQENSAALLLYTSGSTGLPKGAVLSHLAVTSGGENVTLGHRLTADDRALCVLPIYHINGAMVTTSAPLVSGGSVVMPSRFSARSYWQLVAEYGCTWSSVVPTIIKYLLDRAGQEPYDFGSDPRLEKFRFGRSASAPLPAVVLKQWEDTFQVPMIETLGLTETAGTVASNPLPPAERKAKSVGLAYGNEIRILDDQGRECAPGSEGEVAIRGCNVLGHYYKNPEATDSAFFGDWFRTGDLGKLDEDGYLFLTGRLKELIIRGGENIAPREIDDVLYKHESILEAAAVGIDDDNYGQEVVACVVLRHGFRCTEQELKSFCSDAIGEVKTPKTIYFMDDLPKGPSGKILRLQLPDLISRQA